MAQFILYTLSVFGHFFFRFFLPNKSLIILNNFWQEETQEDSESEDDEQQIYNPLKLPMGWDGKPIPYWLYKLHGLGQVLFIVH